MKKTNDLFESIFDDLSDKTQPTDEQKEKMLKYVLMENKVENNCILKKIGGWITVYPWRFAFGTAAIQTVVFALIFGRGYTNLLLSMFGG